MIRYPVTEQHLIDAINQLAPNWIDDAAARIAAFRKAGRYNEERGNWSTIKDAYMALQFNKCAYCERKLAGGQPGRIEHDVEHYRPKSEVKVWPTAEIRAKRNLNYDFATGDALPEGYYLLSYHIFNYATACKTCNSYFKSSYFPIANARGALSEQPTDFAAEGAFILYPVGSLDDDPETIMTFEGIVPVPRTTTATSVRHRRAQVTIDFFMLDLREELLDERSRVNDALWIFLQTARIGETAADREYAQESVDLVTASNSAHASCARAFVALYQQDRRLAREFFTAVHEYLLSKLTPGG